MPNPADDRNLGKKLALVLMRILRDLFNRNHGSITKGSLIYATERPSPQQLLRTEFFGGGSQFLEREDPRPLVRGCVLHCPKSGYFLGFLLPAAAKAAAKKEIPTESHTGKLLFTTSVTNLALQQHSEAGQLENASNNLVTNSETACFLPRCRYSQIPRQKNPEFLGFLKLLLQTL